MIEKTFLKEHYKELLNVTLPTRYSNV